MVFFLYACLGLMYVNCTKQVMVLEYQDISTRTWETIVEEARGQEVFFNAWGGSSTINSYIEWVKARLADVYQIKLVFVPLDTTGSAVTRILQERASESPSSVDVLWVNGQNFRSLAENDALFGDILNLIPNKDNISANPLLYQDFTLPTMGREVPWGTAQLTFFHSYGDQEKIAVFDFSTLILNSQIFPGTFTYPTPLDFHGLSFLKTLLYVLSSDKDLLFSPYQVHMDTMTDGSDDGFSDSSDVLPIENELLKAHPLWKYLDTLHPLLYQKGEVFPINHAEMLEWYSDGLIRYAFSFNPYEAINKILDGSFPKTTTSFVPQEGTLANAHFLTIPKGSRSPQAALVLINFLLSLEAQVRKADPKFWGDPTVLELSRFSVEQQSQFAFDDMVSQYPAALPPPEIGVNTIPEFHSSWELPLIEEWQRRYAR